MSDIIRYSLVLCCHEPTWGDKTDLRGMGRKFRLQRVIEARKHKKPQAKPILESTLQFSFFEKVSIPDLIPFNPWTNGLFLSWNTILQKPSALYWDHCLNDVPCCFLYLYGQNWPLYPNPLQAGSWIEFWNKSPTIVLFLRAFYHSPWLPPFGLRPSRNTKAFRT